MVKDEPWNLIRLIENAESLKLAKGLIKNPKQTIKLDEVVLEAPILRPRKFLGLGMNYKKHKIQFNVLRESIFKFHDYQFHLAAKLNKGVTTFNHKVKIPNEFRLY